MAPVATLFWPTRRLNAARAGKADQLLWLAGFRVAEHAICVVEITFDRSSVSKGLDVIGVCRSSAMADGQRDPKEEEPLVVVEYATARGDPDAADRSVRVRSAPLPFGAVVLYDPALFMCGRAHAGIAAMVPLSPLKAPLQQLQTHFEGQMPNPTGGTSHGLLTACEASAYYTLGLPCAAVNALWEKTLLAIVSAPLLRSVPVGRGAALKDYSQCLRVFTHRLSNILALPAQVAARYRSRHGCVSYTELSDFVVYLLVDYALGLAFTAFVTSAALPMATERDISPLTFLDTLREHVVWLMDAPAGFKLNDRLAAILANGILMWLDFWVFLLDSVVTSSLWQAISASPMLCAAAFQCWQHAGLTLQLSAIADAQWLMTWNSYWVFLYFTKLNAMQLRLLSSLWKLFLGKKNNVLRKRVDSCEYDVNQLLLGTLLFTILVFLVTTNAVFFVFFGLVRFGVWISSAVLWFPIVALRGFPIVSVLHRVLYPHEYTAKLSIETTDDTSSCNSLTLEDISPSRRRARDEVDRAALQEFYRQESTPESSDHHVLFRVVTQPSSLGQCFHRLQAYQAQVTRAYDGSAIVQSCLFGAEIAPVDASVLFRTVNTAAPKKTMNAQSKRKRE